MRTLRLILGDHLSRSIASLKEIDRARDVVLMVEVAEEATYVRHHKQKIALVLSAMRHFAAELAEAGCSVDYVRMDAAANTGTFVGELERAWSRHRPDRIVVCEPGEWRVQQALAAWRAPDGTCIDVLPDDRFFATRERFARWAGARKSLRMEFFYRELRRETGILMDDGAPAGGRWNFDADNRRPWPADREPPQRLRFAPDDVTRKVIAFVERRFGDHFGSLEAFGWPVSRADALAALDHFVAICLERFGDFQDAMKREQPWLCHSLLAPALNLGLLLPREVCARAEAAYRSGAAPLNAVEGFIRQILGWREYVRGVYWHGMPDYARTNALEAHGALPAFYWTGQTPMRCMSEVIRQTREFAYAHHIQRLMITGNFALLAGVRPEEIEAWYLAVYADAFEWVELPNTHGMAMFADGGLLASKPYAASGAYVARMSDYCKACAYDVRRRTGAKACPFNALYWAFLIRHEQQLSANPRMAMPYRTLSRWSSDARQAIVASADAFLATCGVERSAEPRMVSRS